MPDDVPPDDQWIRNFIAEEPERVRKLLAAAIKASGLSQRALEKRLGWSPSTISNVLRGRVELKQVHATGIVLAAGFHPGNFFERAYPRHRPLGPVLSTDDFAARLAKAGGLPPDLPDEAPPPPRLPRTVAELQQFVAEAVRKALPEQRAPKRKRSRKRTKRSRPAKKG